MAVWSQISNSRLVGASRLDAEFWQPAYITREEIICSGDYASLGSLVTTFKKGIFYILAREYAENGIPFYRSSNVGSILPNDEGLTFITKEKHQEEFNTALEFGDLMIVKTGKSGASVVLNDQCNVSQDVIATKVRRNKVNPYYLSVYLNTTFGVSEMNRWFQGQVQPHLSLEDARRIWVALIPGAEQNRIENLVLNASHLRECAEKSWANALFFLESELGLAKLNNQKPVGYKALFSDLTDSQRADAQHFQPQFTQLLSHLVAFPTQQIREIRTYNRRGVQPIYVGNGAVDVVNSQHLGPKHIDYEGLQKTSPSDYSTAPEAHIRPNDILIYSTGAYVGRTNVYLSERPALASNHVNILRLREGIDSAYMSLVFQSEIGKFQTQKHVRGSAQAELYPADIDRFVVPLNRTRNAK